MAASQRVFEILLIEDNPAEQGLISAALAECGNVEVSVRTLIESKDAIVYLRGGDPYGQTPRPDLILLDYHMPIDGGIALTEIKGDPDYMDIPVVVVTGSPSPKDIRDCYLRHANCCFHKPNDFDAMVELMCAITDHWLLRAALPASSNRQPA